MSDNSSKSWKRLKFEEEFIRFLTKRICNVGGSIKLQHITGHLSQIRPEIRNTLGSSISDILNFIETNRNIFNIDNDIISLVNSPTKDNSYDSNISGVEDSLPDKISNGTGGSKSRKRLKFEKEFIRFLTKRICNVGGSIKLQHIIGHLSQVRLEIRNTLGSSKSDILNFIETNRNIFNIDNDIISLVNCPTKDNSYDSDISGVEDSLPDKISNGTGVIVKLASAYGFITVKDPIKTSVFFSAATFLNSGYIDQVNFAEYGLRIGSMINFNARRKKKSQFAAKYFATKVWKCEEVCEENNISQRPKKNHETGLYDPVNLDGEGVIQSVFPSIGFIAVNSDKNNSVYFSRKHLVNYDNNVNLTKIFYVGDFVEFNAHTTEREDARTRWIATKVWIKSGESISVNKQENCSISKSDSGVISSDQSDLQSPSSSSPIHLMKNIKQNSTTREMLHNQSGKICSHSNGVVIKFGENLSQLADGDSSTYYMYGAQVTDISLEFSEGDDVIFDAVKIQSAPGWKAVLVWIGHKPRIVLPACLDGFSTFTDYEDYDDDKPRIVSPTCLGDFRTFTDYDDDKPRIVSSACLGDFSTFTDYENFYDEDDSCLDVLEIQDTPSQISPSKSEPMKSEFRDFKSTESLRETSNLQDSAIKTISNLTSKDNTCKRPNLPPFHKSLCSLSSHESKISDKFKLGDEKYPRNKLNNMQCKSGMNDRDIPQFKTGEQTISQPKDYSLTDIQEDRLQLIPEYLNLSSDINEEKTRQNYHEFIESSDEAEINNDLKNMVINCENTAVKKPVSIKKFQNLVGEIVKVYPTFAEIKSSALPSPAVFFGRILYCETKSMVELKDMRKMLKVGDTVQFNYFEIVDDMGQTWNKVSLVWSGPKPLCFNEITTSEFIHRNELSVSINNECNNVPVQQTINRPATAFDEVTFEYENGCISRTESCSDVGGDACYKTFLSPVSSEIPDIQEKLLAADEIKMLFDSISQKMVAYKSLFGDSEIDFSYLSPEVINLLLERFTPKESSFGVLNTSLIKESSANESSNPTCLTCEKKNTEKASQNKNTKNAEVQTSSTTEAFTGQNMINIIILSVLIFLMFYSEDSEYFLS